MDKKARERQIEESRFDDHFDKVVFVRYLKDVEKLDATHWRLIGLVICHEIKLGNIISAWGRMTKINQHPASFKLLRIEAYDRDLPYLGMSYWGRLTLEGKGGEVLKVSQLLLRRMTSP